MRGFMGTGGALIRQCWRHSAACAIIAQELSPLFDITGDSAYTLGLLHDIGRLGLLKSYASEYAPLLGESFEDVEQVLLAERAILQVDHGVAGAYLVKNWAFPKTFAHTCEHHHEPIQQEDSELLQVIKVSCMIADALGYSSIQYTKPLSYEKILKSLPIFIRRDEFPKEEKLKEDVAARLKIFE
jgi:HD-like signal output (HDOD) protein